MANINLSMQCYRCNRDYSYFYKVKERMNVFGCVKCGYIERVVPDEEMDKLLSGPRPFEVVKYKDTFSNKEDLK